MNMLLTGSDDHKPTYKRYTAYQCRANRSRPFRLRAYRSRAYQYRAYRSRAYRYRAYRCIAHRTRHSRSRAYIIKLLHPECCLFKTNFHQLLCNNEYAINWE